MKGAKCLFSPQTPIRQPAPLQHPSLIPQWTIVTDGEDFSHCPKKDAVTTEEMNLTLTTLETSQTSCMCSLQRRLHNCSCWLVQFAVFSLCCASFLANSSSTCHTLLWICNVFKCSHLVCLIQQIQPMSSSWLLIHMTKNTTLASYKRCGSIRLCLCAHVKPKGNRREQAVHALTPSQCKVTNRKGFEQLSLFQITLLFT